EAHPASAVSGAGDSCRPASWPRRQSWLPRPSAVPNYLTKHMRLTIEAFPPFSGALAGIITANAPLSAEVPSFWGQSGQCERQVHTDPANGPGPAGQSQGQGQGQGQRARARASGPGPEPGPAGQSQGQGQRPRVSGPGSAAQGTRARAIGTR